MPGFHLTCATGNKEQGLSLQLRAFHTPEHNQFLWRGEENAALLVHGFPGTPAEMRRVGRLLHEAGWTAQGLLLPGFGRTIGELPQRRHADWVAAIEEALAGLEREHRRVILVGNSMGAALSLHAAARHQLAGLILFSPFWRIDSWLDKVYPVAATVLPEIRPFQRAKFNDPKVRSMLCQFLPEADLDDDAVQAALRDLRIPTRVLGQVRRSGQLGYHAAARVTAPTLIVQGMADTLVRPPMTRQLAARLPQLADYVEVPGGHELVNSYDSSWPTVAAVVARYLSALTAQKTAAAGANHQQTTP
jgi:carboxylesterase